MTNWKSSAGRFLINLLFGVLLSCPISALAQSVNSIPLSSLPQNSKYAIWGDSITEVTLYPQYTEMYLLACAGRTDIKVMTFGHSGEGLGGLLNRQIDLQAFNPTVLSFNYGMNDTQYDPYTSAKGMSYDTTMQQTLAMLINKGITQRIVAGPDPVDNNFDPTTADMQAFFGSTPTGGLTAEQAQNVNLSNFSAFGYTEAMNTSSADADVYDRMNNTYTAAQAVLGSSYDFTGDGIHPVANGHLMITYELLKSLACTGNIGTITVNMSGGTATATTGHTVVSYSNGTVILDSTQYPFCYNYNPNNYQGASGLASVLPYLPFSQDLNRFMLVVNNLGASSANVTWGGQTMNFTSAQLSAGVNLAASFTSTPFDATFAQVMNEIYNKQVFEDFEIKGTSNYNGNDNGGNVDSNMIAVQANFDAAVKALIVPVRHAIVIVPTGASTAVVPVITGTMMAYPTVGQSFSYQISALGSPSLFTATGLPTGLTMSSSGLISGTPVSTGITVVTLSATNSYGTSLTTHLTLDVLAVVPQAPSIANSPLTASATVGSPFSYQIVATNNPTNYFVVVPSNVGTEPPNSSLPPGLTYNTTTGVFSGTPTTAGVYNVEITAMNAGGVTSLYEGTPLVLTISAAGGGAPPAPGGLTATPGSGQVGLSWSASAGATSYSIYRGTTAGGESTTALATGITTTTYTDTSAANGTTYYYVVKAVNSSGTSSASNEVSAMPTSNVPAAPTGLTATPGNASVTLAWTGSAGATSYNVYRGTSPGGEGATAVATGITELAYYDVGTGLTNGTIYYYEVKAVNGSGTSGYSNEASATPVALPATPTGLTATAGSNQVSLSWTASSGATSYNLYRSTTSGGEGTTALVTGITTASYTNTGLTNGTAYYYTVAAVNSSGTSSQSSEASATPSAPTVPAAPTGLTATAGNTQIALNWTASTGATSYNLYRSTTSGGEGTTALVTGITTTSYTNTGLTNGTAYYYKVAAVNSVGTSSQSSEASATPNASQQLVGVQYQTNGSTLISSSSAGVVSQSGWNTATLPYVTSGTNSVSNLVTSTGTASGISESTTSCGGYDHPSGGGFTSGTGNFDLFAAFALGNYGGVTNDTVTLTGLSASQTYSLITYVASSSSTDVLSGGINVSGAPTYYLKGTVSNTFTQGLATTSAAAAAGNYFEFTGITGVTSVTFTLSDNGSGTASLYGFQVVVASGGGGSAPAAPTGLTATPGNATAALSWTASSGATSYNVYRGTTSGGESTTALATGVTTTTYTDSTAANGTTYYYEVKAVNSSGTSGYSNEANATPTAPAPPAAPTGLTATAGNAQVALAWTASTGATSYNVYRGTTSGGESTTALATGVTTTTYTDSTAANGTTYYYEVKAVNANGTSGYSNEASATPTAPAPPAAPTGLTATAGNAQVALAWTASTGATSYNVYRGTTSGGESTTAIATGVTTTTYTDSSAANGTTYYYEVKAVNANGTSGYSNEASAKPTAPAPPGAPTGLTATAGNAQVALAWTASTGATSYNVYRGTTSGGESTTALATGVTTTTYTDSTASNGTAYFYEVKAVNANGSSGYSNEASASPSSSQQLIGLQYETNGSPLIGSNSAGAVSQSGWNEATLPYVTSGTNSVSNLLTSTGTASGISESTTSCGGYDSPRGSGFTSGTGNFDLFAGFALGNYGGVTSDTVTLTGLSASQTYSLITYVVSSSSTDVLSGAINVSGAATYYIKGGVSNTLTQGSATTSAAAAAGNYFEFTNITGVTSVTFTLSDNGSGTACLYGFQIVGGSGGGSAPSAPTGLTATPGNATAALSWTASSGATSYNVYRGTTSGGESTTALATGVTTTTYTDSTAANGTTYYYEVKAVNASGTSGYSNEASATPSASQQVVGVQYETNGSPLIGSNSAGAVSQSGWNEATLGYVTAGTNAVSNLLTSTGAASGISESTTSCGGYDHPSGGGFTTGTGNADLFGGFALGNYGGVTNDTVTLTGLTASKTYSLITYVASSSSTDVLSGAINVSGAATYYIKNTVSNTLTQGSATTSAAATAGNYFEFTNITGVTSVTFTLSDNGSGTSCLYGFQLVGGN